MNQKEFVNIILVIIIVVTAGVLGYFALLQKLAAPSITDKETVILAIDQNLYNDNQVRPRIERYQKNNNKYKFITILFSKTQEPVSNPQSSGGTIKKNSLELRNAIKQIYDSKKEKLIGVFLIGNLRPTIWRDANLWKDLGQSEFYPSIYPLIALDDDYYSSFDVNNEGFYEKPGVTRGSEIGGGYNASIWGAVLIPPLTYSKTKGEPGEYYDSEQAKKLIVEYFDRDHLYYIKQLTYDTKLLYSNSFGCSQGLYSRVGGTIWNKTKNTFLCPNLYPGLGGFNSVYQVLIHNKGKDYKPEEVGFNSIIVQTYEEKVEFDNWTLKDYFGDSKLTAYGVMPSEYYFLLHIKGRSISEKEIKEKIQNNLPPVICGRIGDCEVYVSDFGFEEEDGTWDGFWVSYIEQQHTWTKLYTNLLKTNKFQFTYLNTHGAPTFHLFDISSDTVKSGKFNSMIYEIESCNTGNYLSSDYIAGNYLFYGNTLGVSAYSIPFVQQGRNSYLESDENLRFLKIKQNEPVINALFLKNYGNYIYFGDPLLELSMD